MPYNRPWTDEELTIVKETLLLSPVLASKRLEEAGFSDRSIGAIDAIRKRLRRNPEAYPTGARPALPDDALTAAAAQRALLLAQRADLTRKLEQVDSAIEAATAELRRLTADL